MEKMEYIAHIDGKRIQTIKEHLEGTAELAGRFASKFGKEDWGFCCGMLHDIGKYSNEFQKRICGKSNARVDHSTAGARVCEKMGGLYSFMSYCIAGHHAGLPDYDSSSDADSESTLLGRRRKKIYDYHKYQEEIQIPEINTLPFDPKIVKNQDFSLSMFIRMLYSCLVDADFLDTEAFMKNGDTGRISGEEMHQLLQKLERYTKDWMKNQDIDTVNGRRTEILQNCYEMGKAEKGLFRLTVPTGGGKTIASLAFALKHAVKHHMDRVIYVIPYTSIIEQNAKIFRDILGEENVLENHYNVDYEISEEFNPMQLAAENWDKPVIVTTNVQFFESLFANRSSKCRKLHNIANSVVIFDEAQMLPNEYLIPCTAMIEELIRNYRVSAVLSTATQPSLNQFFGKDIDQMELCPRMEEQFHFFKRTKMENIGTVEDSELIEKLSEEFQALCIVNTRKKAQELYNCLKGEGVYHLSTSMYPKHRKQILSEIREKLRKGERCILISTSLVEAGVDLDFQAVYRQLAGVDSMIQAAGRCNREGKRSIQQSRVYIFEFPEKKHIPGQRRQIDAAKLLIEENIDLSAQESITQYFKILYNVAGGDLDKKKIMEEFKGQRYHFAKVGKVFRLIEEKTITVFIHNNEEAEELFQEIRNQGFSKARMRKAGQYCINIREPLFRKMEGAGMLRSVSEDMPDFYELTDCFQYTEDMGLDLEIQDGTGCFL